jgi:hypothetical protein
VDGERVASEGQELSLAEGYGPGWEPVAGEEASLAVGSTCEEFYGSGLVESLVECDEANGYHWVVDQTVCNRCRD